MLEAAIVVSGPLREYPEAAAVVALLLVFNAALSLFQQSRAQTTLDALKTRLALNAQVKRDGAWITAPAANLVADAIVKLTLGAVVPAEVRVLTGSVLVDALATEGFRIIAVAAGPTGDLTLQGLIGLSDPPRDDAAGLVAELATLGGSNGNDHRRCARHRRLCRACGWHWQRDEHDVVANAEC
jgi:magnesium-transporting ATPase (P-type)